MREILVLGSKLLLIAALSGLLLGATNSLTKDAIQAHEQEAFAKACREVFPEGQAYETMEAQGFETPIVSAVEVKDNAGALMGYVFNTSGKGYGGDVPVTVGVSMEGTLTGIRVGANSETQGYGSKASEAGFYEPFSGIPAEPFEYGQGVDAISGATRTSNAVKDAVNLAIEAYKEASESRS